MISPIVGSVRLKKDYFSSKHEGALVFIPNDSPWCKDHISVETQANFNLATLFFVLKKCYFEKYKSSHLSIKSGVGLYWPTTSVIRTKNSVQIEKRKHSENNRHPLSILTKADKETQVYWYCFFFCLFNTLEDIV
jgi:hypothetical protein